MAEPQDRRLAAVMFCDMVGFTAAMQEDEQSALASRDRYRTVIEDLHGEFGGQIVQYYGDGTLSIFTNSVDAVRCAVAIQQTLGVEPVVPVRVGLHVGDVVVEEHGLLGDAVNVASRIESFGQPGAVLVSDSVHDLIKNQPDLELVSLGEFYFDNVTRPHELFAVDADGLVVSDAGTLEGKGRPVGVAVLSNLPVQVTSFVGRVQESAELEKLIRGSRLVTVTGAGGCGKSRLAVQVAAELLGEYADGVWLVELAPLSDGRLVASTVANVLGVREQAGVDTLDILTRFLSEKDLLLVVDNCEHLIEPVAELVAHLLTHTADVRVVATSREPLHVRGEAVYHLPTLPVPDEDDDWETLTHVDSVRLFAERAESVHPGFRVTHDNGGAVASICRHLDGIPLAVELAAAATRMFTPEQIEERLDDRFRLLTAGARDDVDYHRTLQAAIDWSHQLLTQQQQAVFARLGVFAGGFPLDAAEQVCADDSISAPDVIDAVVHLADSSLLEVGQSGEDGRYGMLETIRAYASGRFEELPESDRNDLNTRHFGYCLSLAEQAVEGPMSAQAPPPWLAVLDSATPDLRKALRWSIGEGHDQKAVDLAGALGWYWRVRKRHTEGLYWSRSVPLHSPTVTRASRSRALRSAALFMSGFGTQDTIDPDRAQALVRESLSLARQEDDPMLVAASLNTLSHVSFGAGDTEATLSATTEGIEIAESIGDRWRQAHIRHYLALHHRDYGPVETAKRLLEENLNAFRELGDDRMVGFTLAFLARIDLSLSNDLDHAVAIGNEVLGIGRRLNDPSVLLHGLLLLGDAHYRRGDLKAARSFYQDNLEHTRKTRGRDSVESLIGLGLTAYSEGDLAGASSHLHHALSVLSALEHSSGWDLDLKRRNIWSVALLLAREERFRSAAVLLAFVEASRSVNPNWTLWLGEFEHSEHHKATDAVESELSLDELQQAQQQGAAMTLDEALDYALNLLNDA